jgi:hypothetical protein
LRDRLTACILLTSRFEDQSPCRRVPKTNKNRFWYLPSFLIRRSRRLITKELHLLHTSLTFLRLEVEDDSNTFQEYHQEEERFHGNLLQHISLYCVFSSKTLLYPKGTEPVKTGKPALQTILLVWNLFV